jgi:hypothetical protein
MTAAIPFGFPLWEPEGYGLAIMAGAFALATSALTWPGAVAIITHP